MTQETFNLIDAVCREGVANDVWGVAEDFNTSDYFASMENIDLNGKFLYVYRRIDDDFSFIRKFQPTHILHIEDDYFIDLYQLR